MCLTWQLQLTLWSGTPRFTPDLTTSVMAAPQLSLPPKHLCYLLPAAIFQDCDINTQGRKHATTSQGLSFIPVPTAITTEPSPGKGTPTCLHTHSEQPPPREGRPSKLRQGRDLLHTAISSLILCTYFQHTQICITSSSRSLSYLGAQSTSSRSLVTLFPYVAHPRLPHSGPGSC